MYVYIYICICIYILYMYIYIIVCIHNMHPEYAKPPITCPGGMLSVARDRYSYHGQQSHLALLRPMTNRASRGSPW